MRNFNDLVNRVGKFFSQLESECIYYSKTLDITQSENVLTDKSSFGLDKASVGFVENKSTWELPPASIEHPLPLYYDDKPDRWGHS